MSARILLVEDDDKIRSLVRRILVRKGHEIIEASDGGKALALLRVESFDLIITDMMMPDTDGIELLQSLEDMPERPPAVIAMSGGMAAWCPLPSAEMLGASETLAKPFTAEELIAIVDRQLALVGQE